MQKVVVITDNPVMASRFEKEVWSQVESGDYNLSFKCSIYSNPDQFDLDSPIEAIDLKQKQVVEALKTSYIVFSIHCKQLFPKELVQNTKCINVHPGYNPYNRGWYPQVFSIINKTIIGATIHEIDEQLDHGSIIAREEVEKFEVDTSLTLYNRILDKEIELLQENIASIMSLSYTTILPEIEGKLYLKKDFNELCNLDLDENLTMKDAINKLRALTHGEYKNAYFFDSNGKKVFLSINLEYGN